MVGRLKLTVTFILAAVLVAPGLLQAQDQGRFRVLVPYFYPLQGADDDFGKDASKELRKLLDQLPTHEAIEEKEIKNQAKRFGLKMDEMDCIKARQLAAQINAKVVLCAEYTENPDKTVTVNARFYSVDTNEEFPVSPVTVPEKEKKQAAQQILNEFDQYVQQERAAAICADYYQSQLWEDALRSCDEALRLNPDANSVRFLRARILYEMERYDEALQELEKVLAANPVHEDALQTAGYVATVLGRKEEARSYYERYLDLNPANAAIRMNIAYELAKNGDPRGAMAFIEEGLAVDPENPDLLEQYARYAFSAALQIEEESAVAGQDAGALSPEAQELYRKAIEAFEKVFEIKGAEMRVEDLRQIIAAYIQLGELDNAISFAERVLETHPQEDSIWSIYADALQRAGRLDEAIAALDRVREINPSHPNAALRQGNWLIQAGRIEDAVAVLKEAVVGNPERADQAAGLIFAYGYQNGYQKKNYPLAIRAFAAAKELPNLSEKMKNQLNFWHGFALFQQAVVEQQPNTLETAKATLPKFKRALELLNQSGDYPSTVNLTLSEIADNVNAYIEIQEAIIKRGR